MENNSTKPMEAEIGEQEQDIGEIELEQEAPKNRKAVQNKRSKNLKHQENLIDEDEEVLAKKKKKNQPAKRIVVELSDLPRNVPEIAHNIL